MSHHWLENNSFGDESEDAENPQFSHVCKHCNAVGNLCEDCGGEGTGGEDSWEDRCAACDGDGVIYVSGGDVVYTRAKPNSFFKYLGE